MCTNNKAEHYICVQTTRLNTIHVYKQQRPSLWDNPYFLIRDSTVDTAGKLLTGRSEVLITVSVKNVIPSKTSRPYLGPIQPHT